MAVTQGIHRPKKVQVLHELLINTGHAHLLEPAQQAEFRLQTKGRSSVSPAPAFYHESEAGPPPHGPSKGLFVLKLVSDAEDCQDVVHLKPAVERLPLQRNCRMQFVQHRPIGERQQAVDQRLEVSFAKVVSTPEVLDVAWFRAAIFPRAVSFTEARESAP